MTVDELRAEMQAEFGKVYAEFGKVYTEFADVRAEIRTEGETTRSWRSG